MVEKKHPGFVLIAMIVAFVFFGSTALAFDPPIASEYETPIPTIPSMPVDSDGMIPGMKEYSGTFNGISRVWYVYVPQTYTGKQAVPLVVHLHGGSGRDDAAKEGAFRTTWPKVADKEGFIVLFPQGAGKHNLWGNIVSTIIPTSGNNDSSFLQQLINKMKADYNIDATRIYMTGISLGGFMVDAFAITNTTTLTAVCTVSGQIIPEMPAGNPTGGENIEEIACGINIDPNTGLQYKPKAPIPYYAWHGQYDNFDPTLAERLDKGADFWNANNSNSLIANKLVIDERFNTRIHTGGKAEYRATEHVAGIHSNDLSLASVVWHDFFSRFRRSPDGSVIEIKSMKMKIDKSEDSDRNNSVAFIVGTAKALVDSQHIVSIECAPQETYADKTLVPLSAIEQTFRGAKVHYDPKTMTAVIRYKNTVGSLTMETPIITINEDTIRQIDVGNPIVVDGNVMVPIRPIAQWVLKKHVAYSSGAVYVSNNMLDEIDSNTAHMLGQILNP